jgi:hypothetical protein
MTLRTDDAKQLPDSAAVRKYRQEQLASTGIEAGILERPEPGNSSSCIRQGITRLIND